MPLLSRNVFRFLFLRIVCFGRRVVLVVPKCIIAYSRSKFHFIFIYAYDCVRGIAASPEAPTDNNNKKKKKRRKEQMKCVFGPDSARRVGNAHFCAPPLSHSDSLHSLPLDFLSFFLFRFAHFGFTSRAHTIASEWTKKPTKRIEPKSTHLRWMRE